MDLKGCISGSYQFDKWARFDDLSLVLKPQVWVHNHLGLKTNAVKDELRDLKNLSIEHQCASNLQHLTKTRKGNESSDPC